MLGRRPAPPGGRHTPNLPALLRTTAIAMSLFVVVMAAVLAVLAWLSGTSLAPGAVPGGEPRGRTRGWIQFHQSSFGRGLSLFLARADGAVISFDGARPCRR